MMQRWKVSREEAGTKLISFLKSKLGESYSARQLKRAIEENLCAVNGLVERFASYKLKGNDAVRFETSGMKSLTPKKFDIDKRRILYEDESLFLYNKPSGITSDETGLLSLLKGMYLVHRLDRETTGVIIFAKNDNIQKHLTSQFRNHEVKKVYLAIVDGIPKKKSGVIENYLGKVSRGEGQPLWGVVSPRHGKFASTAWKCQKSGKEATVLRCFPQTGRTHQIRIHMKALGHPVLGDYRYTKKYKCSYLPKRCMLHALEIAFPHPLTGKTVRVNAPAPKDFNETVEKILL